jgi:AraC family transcriptional regulator, transcriptional activator of pobA
MNDAIPSFGLYGRHDAPALPDIERLRDRAGPGGWRIPPHRHPALHQLFLILSGGAFLTIDGRGHELALPALVFVPPAVVHGFRFDAGTEGHVLTLPAGVAPDLLDPGPAAALGLDRWGTAAPPPGTEALFEALLLEAAAPDALGPAALRGLALQLLARTARALAQARPAPAQRRADRHLAALEGLIRAHLAQGWGQGWGVPDFAAALGLTATHLTRICTARTGLSPARLIEARRMAEARRLLAYTDLTVAQVGYALGFEDPAYFSRAFRRVEGASPGAFRRRAAATDLPQG